MPAPDWLLYQLADSAFPIGGFAHSAGLEAACQHGFIRTPDDLLAFLHQSLHQIVDSAIPFLLATFDDPETALDHDAHLDAMLSNHVANRASRAQGQALLATAERAFPSPQLKSFRTRFLAAQSPGHLPVTFGLVTRLIGIERTAALRLYLFTCTRAILSAAVRLGAVGPLQAQNLQATLPATLDALTERASRLTLDDAATTAPFLDLLQSTQDRLYSRLFQS